MNPTIYLGSEVDAEPDAHSDANAAGDDANGTDDDDGILFTTSLIPGSSAQVQVTSMEGNLNGWIDFNGDGDWDDTGEQIFSGLALPFGTNDLSFNIPMDAKVGVSFARFRFSSIANLGPTGPAPDGEVEDYVLSIKTGVFDERSVPEEFKLFQNTPNPFNPETTFQYDLPKDTHIRIAIYNIYGQKVADLIDNMQNAGSYQITWEAEVLPSGTYIIRMQAGEFVQMRKCILMK